MKRNTVCTTVRVETREQSETDGSLERIQVPQRSESNRQISPYWQTIFEAPNEESILKITYSFGELGIAHVAPALPLEDALKMMEKM